MQIEALKKVRFLVALLLAFFNLLQPIHAKDMDQTSLISGFSGFPEPSGFPPALLLSLSPPTPLPDTFQSRLKKYGDLSVCDGISVFTFSPNGNFSQEPVGLSGETVTGKWVLDEAHRFIITGTWGWRNGLCESFPNSRRMIMEIKPNSNLALWNLHDKSTLVYEANFKIRETVKLPVPIPIFRFPK